MPNLLGHGEGALQQPVQVGPDRAGRTRGEIRLLHLAKDLGLADHHGIETGSHTEQVENRLSLAVLVEMRPNQFRVDAEVALHEVQ